MMVMTMIMAGMESLIKSANNNRHGWLTTRCFSMDQTLAMLLHLLMLTIL